MCQSGRKLAGPAVPRHWCITCTLVSTVYHERNTVYNASLSGSDRKYLHSTTATDEPGNYARHYSVKSAGHFLMLSHEAEPLKRIFAILGYFRSLLVITGSAPDDSAD